MTKLRDGYFRQVDSKVGDDNYLLKAKGGYIGLHTGRNNEANKVVRTDENGYIQAGWINTTSGNLGTTAPDRIYASNDGYIRYITPANFFSNLSNTGNNISITVGGQNRTLTVGYASNAGNVYIEGASGNVDYAMLFTTATANGNGRIYADTQWRTAGITFNPSSNTLNVGSRIISPLANHTQTSMRHLDAGLNSVQADHNLYIGYGAQTYTAVTHFYYSTGTTDSTSSRTEFMQINSNGAYALTRFGVNGQSTSYNLYVNGTSYLNGWCLFSNTTIIIPVVGYNKLIESYGLRSDYTSAGYPLEEFLKAWCKYAYEQGAGYVVHSYISPSSRGYIVADIYASGLVTQAQVDGGGTYATATVGLPIHITGRYYPHGGSEIIFGTSYGTWYYRNGLDSGNYTGYLGYIGTTPVQASSAAQAVTGITALTFNGSSSAGTNCITGAAGRIYFGGNFHIDSLGSNATYINHYTSNNVCLVTGGGNVGIGITSPGHKLVVNGNFSSSNYQIYGSVSGTNCNSATYTGIWYYSSNGPATQQGTGSTDGSLWTQAYSDSWVSQTAQDYRTGTLFTRSRNNGTWTRWRTIAPADSDFEMAPIANIVYNPYGRKFTKFAGTNGSWDTHAYSTVGYKECRLTYKIGQTNAYIMVGLNSDPTYNASYDSIDYCWYTQNGGGLCFYESGSSVSSISGHTTYATGDEFVIEYSEGYIRYYHNGVLCREIARSYGTPLYFDSSFHNYGYIYDVVFEPIRGVMRVDLMSKVTDWNTVTTSIFKSSENSTTNAPTTGFIYGTTLRFHREWTTYYTDLVVDLYNDKMFFRRKADGSFGSWRELLHSGNYTSYVNNYYWANVKISTTSNSGTTPTFGKVYISGAYPHIDMTSTSAESSIYFRPSSGTSWGIGKAPWGVGGFGIGILGDGSKLTILDNGNTGIGTTSPSYRLHVTGDSYTTGWSRAGNGFYVHDQGVHYTYQQSGIPLIYLTSNEFNFGASTSSLYFNYRASRLGTTVTNYIWNAGSSTSYATHTMGLLHLKSQSGNYCEGLRIYPYSNWTTILLAGTDASTSGTSANSWSIHNNNGTFYINKNASSGGTNSRAMATSTGWTFGNTSRNSYALNAASFICDSWVRTVGSTGWYNESYGGGWYMSDSDYVRVYNNKRVYNANTTQYAFYTEGGFTGNSLHLLSSRSRFINLYSTLNHIPPFSITGLKSFGYPVYNDPEFASGNNSVYVYNNSGGGTVTITRETSAESANSSGYQLKIVTNGTASPGAGGFVQTISSRANAVFVQIFRAKVPVGWSVQTASNSMGNSYSDNWLTEQAGTGKWEWYARIVHCGADGTFSSGGHVYLIGTSNTSVTWYLSYCNVIDITKSNYDGLRTKYSDEARYLYDKTNGTATYSNYGAAGLALSSITWLTCWNGYELRAISKGELGGLTNVSQHTTNNVDYPLVWSNQNNTSTVQSNQLYKSYSDLVYNPANKEVKAWSFAPQGENTNRGIHFSGGSWINSIGTSVIFRNAAIRFGSSDWDWDKWAGISFDGSTTINIGMPDKSIFTGTSGKTAGTIRTVNSKIEVFPNGNSNWGEGIRIHSASNGWTTLVLCGTDNTGFNGTSANSWSLHSYSGNFYLTKNGSETGTSYMRNISNKWYFNTTSGNEVLNVGGWVGTTGSTGWYNSSYGGGIYMTDSTYVRTYNNKAFYVSNSGQHAIYTAGGFASSKSSGNILSLYYNSTWYGDAIYNHGNGNMSIDAPGGSLYLSYYRGNTYFGGGTYYINRSGYFNGTSEYVSRATFGNASNGTHDANAITSNGLWYYSSNGPATSLGATTTDGALYSQAYNTSWVGQIAQDYRNGRLFVRGRNNGSWTSWLRVALYSEIPTSVSVDYTIWRDISSNTDYKIQVVSSLPSSTNSNTFYVIV